MTECKKKPKWVRKRGVAIQVYVSSEEEAVLRALARRRGVSMSALIRNWIRRSAAASVAREPRQFIADPRQLATCVRCGGTLDGPENDWCPACAYEQAARTHGSEPFYKLLKSF